uniref:Uncharacterized protein n=1 Tax=Anguilla anguilla TaxID=7936 RepID=A0A0E9QIM2_ANGAN
MLLFLTFLTCTTFNYCYTAVSFSI